MAWPNVCAHRAASGLLAVESGTCADSANGRPMVKQIAFRVPPAELVVGGYAVRRSREGPEVSTPH
jgi:hypothetical protein